MNRPTFNAMLAQYKRKTVTGTGAVSWLDGVHCELPRVVVRGAGVQAKYVGKNLFDISQITVRSPSATGAYISEVGDNYITISEPEGYDNNGITSTGKKLGVLAPLIEAGKRYRLSMVTQYPKEYQHSRIYLLRSGADYTADYTWESTTNIIPPENIADFTTYVYGFRANVWGAPRDARISNIQIEEGTVATAYEPYTGGVPAPNPNYPIMPQFAGAVTLEDAAGNTVALPELLAIPETEVADEAQYLGGESWRITRRVGVVESYVGEAVGDVWCSSTGELSDGASVWYELATPTTETLALGRLIQPAHGGSVVQVGGDLQCEIEVEYVDHR